MGSSGGKGDSKTQTIKLPPELEALAIKNMQDAQRASSIGYVPYQGPTVAALNPSQVDAMAGQADLSQAFGLGGGGAALRASIPKPTTYANGLQGYDPMALYLQAVQKTNPAQRAAIQGFTNPAAAAAPRPAAAAPRPPTGGAPAYNQPPMAYGNPWGRENR
jgi:hypothetical protein